MPVYAAEHRLIIMMILQNNCCLVFVLVPQVRTNARQRAVLHLHMHRNVQPQSVRGINSQQNR
jgi:hypothetical protein